MALTSVTVSFDISDLAGVDFDPRRTKVYATTNVPGDVVVDTVGNQIRLGSGNATISADGTGSISLWAPGTGSNPDSWQTTIHVDYPDRNATRGRAVESFGPFTITTSANLADLIEEQAVPPTYLTTVTEQLDEYADSASAAATAAAASAMSAAASAELAGAGGGGSSSLIVVSGGTVDLPNDEADGYLVGYKLTATTTIEGVTFEEGSYIFERDSGAAGGWTKRTLEAGEAFTTSDVTGPTAGTLAASAITSTGFTLTVTGASDTVGLHASPYSFSTDNGSTWSAYQSSAVYVVTGKTADVAYQARHRVRDAAGNSTTGTAITVTPIAPPTSTVTETFTRSDGTTLNGLTTTTGGATIISPARSINAGLDSGVATVQSNKVTVSGADIGRAIAILTTQQKYEVSIDYVIATAATTHQARIVARAAMPDDNTSAGNSIILVVLGNGSMRWEVDGGIGGTLAASGIPLSGRMTLRADGTTFTAKINGTQVGSSWSSSKAGNYAVGGAYGNGTSMDNFEVAYYA